MELWKSLGICLLWSLINLFIGYTHKGPTPLWWPICDFITFASTGYVFALALYDWRDRKRAAAEVDRG